MAYQLNEQDKLIAQQLASKKLAEQSASTPAPERKSPTGLAGFLAGALPLIGGAVGSVGGTFLGGPVGTVAGGAAGSGFGELIRQKIFGEEADVGAALKEGALGAVPGVFKGISTATKTAKAGRLATNSPEAAMQSMKPGIAERTKNAATRVSQEGFGLKVGQNMGGGKVLTPDQASKGYDFATQGAQKYGGIRPGAPIAQAQDAQNVFNNVKTALNDTLAKINRPVAPEELAGIGQDVQRRISKNAMITKGTATADKLVDKASKANDLQELEQIRQEADDIAFTASGAKKTSAAAQAKEVRDAIDDFITPLSPEYKAIKGDYVSARDALTSTSKASKEAKGFTLPILNVEVGKQAIPAVKNKAAAMLSGASNQGTSRGGLTQFIKPAISQGVTRAAVGSPLVNTGEQPEVPTTPAQPDNLPSFESTETNEPKQSEQLFSAAMKALTAGDTKTYAVLADASERAQKIEESGATKKKPLSAESAKVLSNAQTGLDALDQIEQQLTTDPSLQQKGGVSGTINPFGLVSGALGTGEYENARAQARDIIARIRTGAALTADEAKAFDKFLPQPGDSAATVKQKIGTLRNQFQFIVDNAGGASSDLQQSMGL